MDEVTLFKFGKCVDYGKAQTREKSPPHRNECGVGHVTRF